jgi:ATP-dependent Clp protease ATP-binding subunit ClpC
MRDMITQEVERHFRPEFLNRVDELVVFNQLTKKDMELIVQIELRKVESRLRARHVELQVDDDVLQFMIDKSFSEDFGARPLKRAIERYLEDPLAEEILRGGVEGPRVVKARLTDGKIVFEVVARPGAAEAHAEPVGSESGDQGPAGKSES